MLLKHSLKVFVMKELTKHSQLSFMELQRQTLSSSGNLGSALNRLLAARYVHKVPNTKGQSIYQVTVKGNTAYSNYVNALKF